MLWLRFYSRVLTRNFLVLIKYDFDYIKCVGKEPDKEKHDAGLGKFEVMDFKPVVEVEDMKVVYLGLPVDSHHKS